MTHLWEIETMWFDETDEEHMHRTFAYKSWKEFQECKPYKFWKPYILSSWSWKFFDASLPEVKVPWKRKENEKGMMDVSTILRVTPSQYDVEKKVQELPKETSHRLQIVFISPDRFTGFHRVEIQVKAEDEEVVRKWIQSHMPTFWKL